MTSVSSQEEDNSNRNRDTDDDEEESDSEDKKRGHKQKNKVKYSSDDDGDSDSETDDYDESESESDSDSESESSSETNDSSYDSDYQFMKPKGKKTRKKNAKPKATPRRNSARKKPVAKSSSINRRSTSSKKINYCEESNEDDGTDTDDMIYKYEEEETTTSKPESGQDAETIEKVLKHRTGRVGAVGSKTAIYNVEEYGDPNAGPSETSEPQYLIKWQGWSHLHNTWESKDSLTQQKVKGLKKLENYLKKEEENRAFKTEHALSPEDIEYLECQSEMLDNLLETHSNVERIIADKSNDYLCKWQGLPYSECTWEDGELVRKRFPKLIEEYEKRQLANTYPPINAKSQKAMRIRPKFVTLKEKPDYLGRTNSTPENPLTLRDYQLDGLNWLANSWCKQNGVILADEMGLGKTVQAISFLSYVFNEHNLYGPFLIVIPLSTIQGWQREFQKWCPEINFVIYLGDSQSRTMIQNYEWYLDNKRVKCNAILTTYEILLKDKAFFNSVSWAALIVDEAHRLKNEDSLLYRTLIKFDTNHRLLVTGTPLQNSLKELWALLHFIMPEKFNQWDEFDIKYSSVLKDGLKFQDLHKELQPYLLRRVKKDVEKSLPAKVEQILRVEMTKQQKQFYKLILTKNYKELLKGSKGNVSTFLNIMMELKKCSNHTYLIRRDEEKMSNESRIENLIRGSGKLFLLDKLLRRLKETGHRVLIFSQMVRMLDIIAEYLQYRRFSFQRLDGSIKGEIRRQALDHFNKPDSEDFCFLLSTRAGGLGINLSTADTVIIYDSDWNPQNDLQAQARAHRIGQKNQVNIYRLVSKSSIEEDIVERAKQKMVLDHLVIQRMDTTGRTVLTNNRTQTNSNPFTKEEINSILKFGAEELFKEETEGKNDDKDYDIDEILKRAETREETGHLSASEELLSQFKVATFSTMEDDRSWNDIIPESERIKIDLEEESERLKILGEQTRRNRNPKVNQNKSDEEYAANESEESSDSEANKLRKKNKSLSTFSGLNSADVRRFVRSYRKFPCPLQRIDTIAQDAQLEEKSQACLIEFATKMQELCKLAIDENKDKKDIAAKKGPIVDINGVKINAQQILDAEKYFEPLAYYSANFEKFNFKTKLKQTYWNCEWSNEDDRSLLKGILEYGYGNWDNIKSDETLGLGGKILMSSEAKEGETEPTKLKPQSKHLRTRIDYLIKVLQNQINVEKYGKNWKEVVNGNSKRKLKSTNNESEDSDNHSDSSDKVAKKKRNNSAEDLVSNENSTDLGHEQEQEQTKKTTVKKTVKKESEKPVKDKSEIVLSDKIFLECKNILRPVKKALKSLNELDSTKDFEEIKRHLLEIGDKINDHLTIYSDPEKINLWRNYLWFFVSKFTTKWNWEKIKNLYKKFSNSRDLYAQPPPSQSSSAYHHNTYPSSSYSHHSNNSHHSYNNSNPQKYNNNNNNNNNSNKKLNHHHNQQHHHHHHHQNHQPHNNSQSSYHSSYHSWKSDNKNDSRNYGSTSKEYSRSRDRDYESNNWEMDPNSKINNFYPSSKSYYPSHNDYQVQAGLLGASPMSNRQPKHSNYPNILNNSSSSPSSSPFNNRKSSSYRGEVPKKFKESRDPSPNYRNRESQDHSHHHHHHHHHN